MPRDTDEQETRFGADEDSGNITAAHATEGAYNVLGQTGRAAPGHIPARRQLPPDQYSHLHNGNGAAGERTPLLIQPNYNPNVKNLNEFNIVSRFFAAITTQYRLLKYYIFRAGFTVLSVAALAFMIPHLVELEPEQREVYLQDSVNPLLFYVLSVSVLSGNPLFNLRAFLWSAPFRAFTGSFLNNGVLTQVNNNVTIICDTAAASFGEVSKLLLKIDNSLGTLRFTPEIFVCPNGAIPGTGLQPHRNDTALSNDQLRNLSLSLSGTHDETARIAAAVIWSILPVLLFAFMITPRQAREQMMFFNAVSWLVGFIALTLPASVAMYTCGALLFLALSCFPQARRNTFDFFKHIGASITFNMSYYFGNTAVSQRTAAGKPAITDTVFCGTVKVNYEAQKYLLSNHSLTTSDGVNHPTGSTLAKSLEVATDSANSAAKSRSLNERTIFRMTQSAQIINALARRGVTLYNKMSASVLPEYEHPEVWYGNSTRAEIMQKINDEQSRMVAQYSNIDNPNRETDLALIESYFIGLRQLVTDVMQRLHENRIRELVLKYLQHEIQKTPDDEMLMRKLIINCPVFFSILVVLRAKDALEIIGGKWRDSDIHQVFGKSLSRRLKGVVVAYEQRITNNEFAEGLPEAILHTYNTLGKLYGSLPPYVVRNNRFVQKGTILENDITVAIDEPSREPRPRLDTPPIDEQDSRHRPNMIYGRDDGRGGRATVLANTAYEGNTSPGEVDHFYYEVDGEGEGNNGYANPLYAYPEHYSHQQWRVAAMHGYGPASAIDVDAFYWPVGAAAAVTNPAETANGAGTEYLDVAPGIMLRNIEVQQQRNADGSYCFSATAIRVDNGQTITYQQPNATSSETIGPRYGYQHIPEPLQRLTAHMVIGNDNPGANFYHAVYAAIYGAESQHPEEAAASARMTEAGFRAALAEHMKTSKDQYQARNIELANNDSDFGKLADKIAGNIRQQGQQIDREVVACYTKRPIVVIYNTQQPSFLHYDPSTTDEPIFLFCTKRQGVERYDYFTVNDDQNGVEIAKALFQATFPDDGEAVDCRFFPMVTEPAKIVHTAILSAEGAPDITLTASEELPTQAHIAPLQAPQLQLQASVLGMQATPLLRQSMLGASENMFAFLFDPTNIVRICQDFNLGMTNDMTIEKFVGPVQHQITKYQDDSTTNAFNDLMQLARLHRQIKNDAVQTALWTHGLRIYRNLQDKICNLSPDADINNDVASRHPTAHAAILNYRDLAGKQQLDIDAIQALFTENIEAILVLLFDPLCPNLRNDAIYGLNLLASRPAPRRLQTRGHGRMFVATPDDAAEARSPAAEAEREEGGFGFGP